MSAAAIQSARFIPCQPSGWTWSRASRMASMSARQPAVRSSAALAAADEVGADAPGAEALLDAVAPLDTLAPLDGGGVPEPQPAATRRTIPAGILPSRSIFHPRSIGCF